VFWGELSDIKAVKDERPGLLQDAVQRGLVQEHGEYDARAPLLRRRRQERRQHRAAEVPVDPDHVQGGAESMTPWSRAGS
jgi:hypothetical protein